MPGDVIDPLYLPFTAEELLEHFAPVAGDEQRKEPQRHLKYYLTSASRYHSFQRSHPERKGLPLSAMRVPCQIEKDERFWVVACLMKCFRSASPVSVFCGLLSRAFGSTPPVSGGKSSISLIHSITCLCTYPPARMVSLPKFVALASISDSIPYVDPVPATMAQNRGFAVIT